MHTKTHKKLMWPWPWTNDLEIQQLSRYMLVQSLVINHWLRSVVHELSCSQPFALSREGETKIQTVTLTFDLWWWYSITFWRLSR